MKKQDSLDLASRVLYNGLREEGVNPKMDINGIKSELEVLWKVNENPFHGHYLQSSPNAEAVKERVEKLAEIVLKNKEDLEGYVLEYRRLHREINSIMGRMKDMEKRFSETEDKIEQEEKSLSESEARIDNITKNTERINNFVIGGFFVFIIAFIGWLVDDKDLRENILNSVNQEAIKVESKLSLYDEKMKNIDNIDKIIDKKVEKQVNEALLEFYKNQNVK